MDVRIHDTIDELRQEAATLVAGYLGDGGTDIALAGGSTPQPIHRHLATMDLSWAGVTLWLGDERWVPHDDEESNTRMARETLTDAVSARLFAPDTSGSDPAISAAHYEIALRNELRTDGEGRLSPGLVMLGMGDDGHTASLFPGTEALDRLDRDYVANWVPAKNTWRLTATLPALWASDRIVFLVTGEAKAPRMREILVDAVPHPAQRVAAGATDVIWMLDTAAASQL